MKYTEMVCKVWLAREKTHVHTLTDLEKVVVNVHVMKFLADAGTETDVGADVDLKFEGEGMESNLENVKDT